MPRIEDLDAARLLGLTPTQILSYAAVCREDLRSVRALLSEALEVIASQQDQLTRATRLVDFQRRQLRAQRGQAAA